MDKVRSLTGGARVGMFNASWPFADLRAAEEGIILKVLFSGTYTFASSEIVEIKPVKWFPLIASGIQIVHRIDDYPKRIIFWYIGSTSTVFDFLRSAGLPPHLLKSN